MQLVPLGVLQHHHQSSGASQEDTQDVLHGAPTRDEDASPVVLNVEYSDVLYTYSTDLEGYLSSASQVIDDINDNNLVEKDPIQSFDINDLDLTNNFYYKLDRGQLGKSLFFGKGALLIVAR